MNSLGIVEEELWHPEAVKALRKYLSECDLLYPTQLAFRTNQFSLTTLDGLAKILRKLGYREEDLGIFHLHDHIPAIAALL